MQPVILIHWRAEEGAQRLKILIDGGFEAMLCTGGPPNQLRSLAPAALIIDLDRLPSQGASYAVSIRNQKENRCVPLVFVGGAAEKTGKIQALLPDAVFTDWAHILPALQFALAHPPTNPVVPGVFDQYKGTPLAQKLGIRTGAVVCLVAAPEGFEATLCSLPENARIIRQERKPANEPAAQVVLLFARSLAELEAGFPVAAGCLAKGGRLWIVWPKKGTKPAGDLSHDPVQKFGLSQGFMDYKICSVDATWSGLCFTRKKSI